MIDYKKYEFCKSVGCNYHYPKNKFEDENCAVSNGTFCPYTAKQFHKWLNKNGFFITKLDRSKGK